MIQIDKDKEITISKIIIDIRRFNTSIKVRMPLKMFMIWILL